MKTKSNSPRIALMTSMTTITTFVKRQASWGVGQVTLRSSPIVSRHQRTRKFGLFISSSFFLAWSSPVKCLKRRLCGRRRLASKQARQESNPQPPVLETGALPIELLAYKLCGRLRFARARHDLSPRFTSSPGARCVCGSGSKISSFPDDLDHYDGSSLMYSCVPCILSMPR